MYVKRLLLSLLVVFVATSAFAATINVTTLADSGPGSLRDAITQANNGNCSHCVITFDVAGEIALTSPLPSLLDGDMTIDGYSAPGALPNTNAFGQPDNAVIKIGINGQGIVGTGFSTGFNLVGNSEELRGLAIYGFTGQGILATSAAKVVILGNFIGTDRSGNNAMPNDRGIVLGGVGANATIGTSAPADRNIISGNNAEGLLTQGGAVVAKMVGNYIGVSASLGALGNNIGVSLLSHNQHVGESTGGNIISGNHSYGIYTAFGTQTITRNIIGTNGSGTAIPNAGGIYGAGSGGLTGSTIDNNTISGNSGFGIRIEQSSGTSITGNRIGVGADGSSAVPNSGPGVLIAGGSNDSVTGNTIANNGGNAVTITGSGKGNVISANAIFSNGGGIDLGGDGATANDATDSDSGPNNLQNWPSVDKATLYTTRLEIVTSINSAGAPGTAGLVVAVYKADASPWPEGMRYLGTSGCIAANTLNGYTFNVPPTGMASGDGVVLVATSYSDTVCTAVNDGSSEFSGGKSVDACIEPVVTITPSASRICAGTSATLDAGSGFASYQWSTGETTRTISVAPSSTTNYSVTVINGLGCSATANTTITVDTPPSPAISPAAPAPICAGGSVTLNASGGGSLQWMLGGVPIGGATGPSYAATAAGSYTVVATNGVCVVTSSPVTVTVNSFPDATVTAPGVVCANGGGSASVPSASGATYAWTAANGVIASGQGTNSITFTATASGSVAISVAVTTNSCTSNGSANVPIDSFSPVITQGGPTSFCDGGNVVLAATAGGVSYQWLLDGSPINSANGSSYNATISGAYSVTVVNSNGCSVTSPDVNVTAKPLPVSTITAPSSVCANTSSSASVPAQGGASYAWSISNGLITAGQGTDTITFTAGASGSVSFGVTVTVNGCSTSGNAQTSIGTFVPSVSASGPTTFCNGGSVTLTASAATSYQWFKNGQPVGSNAQTLVVNASGSYNVVATNGVCSGTSSPVSVTVNSFPDATVAAPGVVCANGGGTASALSASGATYAWTVGNGVIASGQGTNSITFTAASSGTVAISVAVTTNSCTSNGSANVLIDSFSPVVTPGGPTSFCDGGNVVLAATPGGVSYQWLLDGSPINSANGSSYNATASGDYSVTVVNSNGCSATSPAVNVTAKPLPVSTITAPSSVCANTSSTASVPAQGGASYAWSITNGSITAGQGTDTITFTAGASGSVSFGVTVTVNGCSTSGNAQTAIGTFVPSVSASGPTTFCNGGSVTLTASAATSYQWFKNGQPVGSNAQTLVVNASGSYNVTAVDGICSGTSSAVNVVVNPTPTIAIAGPSSVCPDASVLLDATNGFASYHWSTGATTRGITVTPSATTSYSVTGTDANGCSASANFTVSVTPVADPTITAPASVNAAQTGNVASVSAGPAGTSYVWTIDHGTVTSGNGTRSITWDAGNVSPIVISIVATTGSCSVSNQVSVGVNGQADLGVAISAPGSVEPGAPVTITITSNNGGPSVAVNATVDVTLPAGFAFNSVSTVGWTCTDLGSVIACTASSAFLGAQGTITIHATAPAVSGPYDVKADIFSSTPDTNPANDSATAHINVAPVTGGCSTAAPVLLTPFDGAKGVPSNVQFTWSATPNALGYSLYAGSGNSAPSLVATTSSLGANVSLPAGLNTAYVLATFANDCPPLLSARVVFHVAKNATCDSAPAELLTPTALLSPSSPVQFTWKAVNGASNYRLWIAPNGEPAQDVVVTEGTEVSIPLPRGDYSFYIESLFPGCQSSRSSTNRFTVAAKDPCADRALPVLLAPANGATAPVSKIDFRWLTTPNASGYRVWISVDGSPFASLGTTQSLTFPAYIGRGAVEWYVEALFDGCASTESIHRNLTVPSSESCGSELPVLLAPANGLQTSSRDIDFQWSAVPGAVAYEIWVALADNSATLMGTTESTSLRRSMPAGTFDWFVRAIVSGCTSRDSATSRFTYSLPAGCASQRPLLILPVDDARTIIAPVDFHWSKIPGATQYEVWVSSNHLPPARFGLTTDVQLNGQAVPVGAAEWYVVALFDSCPPLASTSNTFTVVGGPSCGSFDIPSLRAPSEVSPDVRYHIRWSSIGSAQLYEIEESLDRDFAVAESFMTRLPEMDFKHSNPGLAAVPYFYRVRSVSVCTGARSLFSPVASVNLLPTTFTGQGEIHASTPADDRQNLHSHLLLGGPGGGASLTATGDTFSVTTNVPWLTVTPSSGTIPAGGVLLDLTMDPSALPFGITSGDLFISTGGGSGSSHGGRIRPLGDTPTTSTPVSVNVSQPVSTGGKNTPAPDSLIFAAVAHAAGGAQSFLSDVRLTNASPQVMKYQLTFTPSGESGISNSKSTSINIEPGRTGALNDVLATWFGVTPLNPSSSGALEVRPLTTTTTSTSGAPRGGVPNVVTFAASRMYSVGSAGSFGQYIPPTAYVNFISKTATDATSASALTLQQTAQSSVRHTNLGLIEGSGDPVTVLLSVFNDAGQKLKDFSQTLKGGQNLQLNSVLVAQGVSFNDGRIETRVTGGNGKVTSYASVVEDATGDSTLISPVSIRSLGATRYVVPGVAQLSSDFANWRTDVRIFNGGNDAVTTTMTYFPQDGEPVSKQVTIAAKEVKTYDSALQSLFGLSTGGGALHIDTTSTSSLVATARTYNQTSTGAFGQFIPAATLADSAGTDSRALQLIELEESSRFRTNLGLAEMTGNAVKVELTIVPPDGKLAGKTVVDLPANGFRQFSSIIRSAGFDSNYDVRVTAKVIGGTGRITAYASVIDMSSGDPTFIPAQ